MKLEEMPTKDLLVLHNRIADKPAGPKTFATRTKLVVRIEQIAADKNIDLASFGRPKKPKATAQRAEPKAEATETPEATEKKPRGLGVGALARALVLANVERRAQDAGPAWPVRVIQLQCGCSTA